MITYKKNSRVLRLLSSSVFVIFSIVMFSTCTDHFDALNTPPKSVTEIDAGPLFTNAQRAEFRDQGTNRPWHFQMKAIGGWPQHIGDTDTDNYAPMQYRPHRRNDNNNWSGTYTTVLRGLSHAEIQLLNESDGDEMNPEVRSKLAMVRILEVHVWERLTATFGDIPFSEAMQGLELVTNPLYDRQEDIYPALLEQLEVNINRLTDGDPTLGGADLFYGGDIDKWRRYGNTLKLRTAMRMRYADEATAQAVISEQMGRPLISNHDQSAMIWTDGGDGHEWYIHGMHHAMRQGFLHGLNQTLIDVLQDHDDPRLVSIAEPLEASKEVFEQTGDPDDLEYAGSLNNQSMEYIGSLAPEDISDPAHHIWTFESGYNPPMQALTLANTLFLQAEAALLGWGANPSEAEQYFQDGIRAAMEMEPYSLDVTAGQIDTYIAQHGTLSNDFEEALEQIMTQKWINHFDMFFEAYFEWRRTSYPRLDPGCGGVGVTDNNIPRRGLYHEDEPSLNSENYNEVVARQGDDMLSKMWIDANPHNGQLDVNCN